MAKYSPRNRSAGRPTSAATAAPQTMAMRRRQEKRQAEHRRGNPGGVGADAEKGLLAERELARDQQQVGRGGDERQQPDAGQYADRVFIHGGLAARSAKSSR